MTLLAFAGAALAEIAGCFAFWAWLRLGASPWWLLPGLGSLALFASLLTLAEGEAAGRTFAAYGGVYVAASLLWLWLAEGQRPDRWDLLGGAVCLLGMAIILWAPRAEVPTHVHSLAPLSGRSRRARARATPSTWRPRDEGAGRGAGLCLARNTAAIARATPRTHARR